MESNENFEKETVKESNILNKKLDDDTVFYIYTGVIVFIILTLATISVSKTSELMSSSPEEIGNIFTFVFYILLVIIACCIYKHIKNIVLKVSRFILDINTTFDVLSSVLILFVGIFCSIEYEIPFWWFLLGSIVYALLMLTKDYVLYLIVDIRDSLKAIADKTEDKNGQ